DFPHADDKACPLPYSYKMPGPIEVGSLYHIHGKIANPAYRVEIDFLEGFAAGSAGQTVFQVSIRLDPEPVVIMNAKVGGQWGKEERVAHPFKVGMPFDVKIRVLKDFMEVYIPGQSSHQFNHRLPFTQVNFIECSGEATFNGFHYATECAIDTLPHERKFPGGNWQVQTELIIFGIATGDSWTVELLGSGGNALFQFVAKYKEKVTVRNANIGGNWGNEEKTGQFPFQRDRGFELSLGLVASGINMLCNNARFGQFAHRTGSPLTDYQGIRISGDAKIVMVRYAKRP
ncbi:hypothetical protein V3C99_012702, partial [Haemonchus contortus]